MIDHRLQRIENEWALLQRMAGLNPALLAIEERRPDEFLLELRGTTAILRTQNSLHRSHQHRVHLRFPRFFPTTPIEAYLADPIFHPNVHPLSGFVCLWSRTSVANTVIEALCLLQLVLTYTVCNHSSDHVMQPAALAWATDSLRNAALPLSFTPLAKPPEWKQDRDFRMPPARRRLSEY